MSILAAGLASGSVALGQVQCDLEVTGTLSSGADDPSYLMSGTQTGRLNRNGVASSCATPKTCVPFDSTPGRAFDLYQYTNDEAGTACVTVTLDVLT